MDFVHINPLRISDPKTSVFKKTILRCLLAMMSKPWILAQKKPEIGSAFPRSVKQDKGPSAPQFALEYRNPYIEKRGKYGMTRKEKLKMGILVLIPIITAMLSFFDGVARMLGRPDWQWDKTVYNCVMIVLTLTAWLATELLFRDKLETGFWKSETDPGVRGLTVLLVNLSACLLIFIKNTETWGYTFGWKHPLSDLWGWPLLWLAAALLLLLIQSPAGKATRRGFVSFVQKLKEAFSLLGKFVRGVGDWFSKMIITIKNGDPYTQLVFCGFLAAFLSFVMTRARIIGTRAVVADHWLLLEVAGILFIGFYLGGGLLYLFPTLLSRLKLLTNNQGRSPGGITGSHPKITISRRAVLKAILAVLYFGAIPVITLIAFARQSNNLDSSTSKDIMEIITACLEFIMAMGDSAERLFL